MTSTLHDILQHIDAPAAPTVPILTPLSLSQLLQMDLPPRELMLGGWLAHRNLAMVFAARGVGKTHFALGVAYAVAGGGKFLGWDAPQACEVLYLDGEMTRTSLRDRLSVISANSDSPQPAEGYLRFVVAEGESEGIPDIATEVGQRAIDNILGETKLLIIDNLATLVRSGKENDTESWSPVQQYLLKLRRKGVSVLLVHHTGKSGAQRGTSSREDVLDAVIKLSVPDDAWQRDGAYFRVEFTKTRAFGGSDARAFDAHLDPVTGQWSRSLNSSESRDDQIWNLHQSGMSGVNIAAKFGITKGAVSKIISRQRDLLAADRLNAGREAPDTTDHANDDDMPF